MSIQVRYVAEGHDGKLNAPTETDRVEVLIFGKYLLTVYKRVGPDYVDVDMTYPDGTTMGLEGIRKTEDETLNQLRVEGQ